jgi:hypothetical protein
VDTSGTSAVSITADLVLLALFGFVGVRLLRGRPRSLPVLTFAAVVVVGVPSLLQFAVPAIGAALQRNSVATVSHGEWWRPFTALLAQDGGLIAAVFNLVVVAGVVLVGEWSWGRVRTLVAFLAPTVAVNLAALAWPSRGGGSSFASDGLMLALTAWAALTRDVAPIRVIAVLQLAIGVALTAMGDAHGLAMLVGAVVGIVIALPTLTARRRVHGVSA